MDSLQRRTARRCFIITQPHRWRDALTYAMFPYLPDVGYYQELIERRWAELEPDIRLIRAEWDCYTDGAPEGIDVVMLDAVMRRAPQAHRLHACSFRLPVVYCPCSPVRVRGPGA